jgi:hypothetical protein
VRVVLFGVRFVRIISHEPARGKDGQTVVECVIAANGSDLILAEDESSNVEGFIEKYELDCDCE